MHKGEAQAEGEGEALRQRRKKVIEEGHFDEKLWAQKIEAVAKECVGLKESEKRAVHSKVELLRMDMW